MITLLVIALSVVCVGVIALGFAFVKAHKTVISEFLIRQKELEELSFIDQKERRAYLGLAEKKIAAMQSPPPQAVHPGYFSNSEEERPEDFERMMAAGNRRMRAEEWRQAQKPSQS